VAHDQRQVFLGGPQLASSKQAEVASWLGPMISVLTGGINCAGRVAATTPALVNYRRSTADVLVTGASAPSCCAGAGLTRLAKGRHTMKHIVSVSL
jgi:hypothetical protein